MNEQDYESGTRAAWSAMLGECLRHLGYTGAPAEHAAWITEREEAIARLRDICSEYGDNDWDDTLHLADIIEKHLHRRLAAKR